MQKYDFSENKVCFANFVDAVNKENFPVTISRFKELMGLLCGFTYIWYTYSGNSHWLVQSEIFISDRIPTNPNMVFFRDKKYMRVLPNIFTHPLIFVINTTGEQICTLAISDET